MPKVTKDQPAPTGRRRKKPTAEKAPATRRRRAAPVEHFEPEPEVRASSVIFGLTMLIALIVAAAAWMGGSLSQVESRLANATDSVARTAGLAVADVTVYGLEGEPELESLVRGAAMIEPGENMFRADPYVIRQRIEQTERVLNVRVHRLWPGQVVILADKAEARAAWQDGDRLAMIDRLGREVPPNADQPIESLLAIRGAGAPAALPALLEAFAEAPDLLDRVRVATRVADRRWTLRLDTGVAAQLPGDEFLTAAVSRLDALERRSSISRRNVAAIDLRAPGSVFITPAKTGFKGETA